MHISGYVNFGGGEIKELRFCLCFEMDIKICIEEKRRLLSEVVKNFQIII